VSRPSGHYNRTIGEAVQDLKGHLNPYRDIQYVSLVGNFAVVGFGTAQHTATLDEAVALRDRLESEKA
jgi:hypothetical protein